MFGWNMVKCFWKFVVVVEMEGCFVIELDGCFLKILVKILVVVLICVLVEVIVVEWDVQGEQIDFFFMLVMCCVNLVLDKVVLQYVEVVDMLVEYGGIDFLCYCVDSFEVLVQCQVDVWDLVLDWVVKIYGVCLKLVVGVMFQVQDFGVLELF